MLIGEGASGGLLHLEGSDELVDVSQHPEEHLLEEISPSRAISLEDALEDLPESLCFDDPPLEEPPLDEFLLSTRTPRRPDPACRRVIRLETLSLGLVGDAPEAMNGGEAT